MYNCRIEFIALRSQVLTGHLIEYLIGRTLKEPSKTNSFLSENMSIQWKDFIFYFSFSVGFHFASVFTVASIFQQFWPKSRFCLLSKNFQPMFYRKWNEILNFFRKWKWTKLLRMHYVGVNPMKALIGINVSGSWVCSRSDYHLLYTCERLLQVKFTIRMFNSNLVPLIQLMSM